MSRNSKFVVSWINQTRTDEPQQLLSLAAEFEQRLEPLPGLPERSPEVSFRINPLPNCVEIPLGRLQARAQVCDTNWCRNRR